MGICWIIKQLSWSILRNIPWFSQLGLRPRRLSIRWYSARFRRIIVKYSSNTYQRIPVKKLQFLLKQKFLHLISNNMILNRMCVLLSSVPGVQIVERERKYSERNRGRKRGKTGEAPSSQSALVFSRSFARYIFARAPLSERLEQANFALST